MELDELKTKWTTINTQLDQTQASQRAMEQSLKQLMLKPSKNRLAFEPGYELIMAGLGLLWSAGFVASHFSEVQKAPIGIAPAMMLFGLCLFTVIVNIRQLILISDVNYANPVVKTQKTLSKVRSLRVRSTQAVLLACLPTWFLFPLFLLQSVVGYEVLLKFNFSWLAANVGVGVLLSAGLFLLARRFGKTSRFFRLVEEAFAGTAVKRAEESLEELEAFEMG